MRQLILLFLAFSLCISPVWAQNNDADLYVVTDVAVDVTADSAAHARDQAIIQAQHAAFAQLVERVGAEPAANKLTDDDLATLVQSFEVQEERTSSVRYIGTFTVQFRPTASHAYLATRGASSFAIIHGNPVVVLPLVNTNGHRILWEENTKWRTAWESASRSSGIVPVIIPAGDLDDIAALSTEEAVSGKASSLKAIMEKYQASSLVVATLNVMDPPSTEGIRIDIQNYDGEGKALLLSHITLSSPADPAGLDSILGQGIKQIRAQFEKDWKVQSKAAAGKGATDKAAADATSTMTSVPEIAPPSVEQNIQEPTVTLPLTVPLISLTEWAQIRGRLNSIPAIRRTNVITLERGATSLELSFTGGIDDLRTALSQQGLVLSRNMANGGWVLRPAEPGDTL